MTDLSTFHWGERTYVMGIINVTPDSFSGDGVLSQQDSVTAATRQAEQFISDGVDILDIGGESTRPGSRPVTAVEEIDRVCPVIEAIRNISQLPISIDTSKSAVVRAAFTSGANWINDVWAFRADEDMAATAAGLDCPVVLMHNRSKPAEIWLQERIGGMYIGADYTDVVTDVSRELLSSVTLARSAGVKEEHIILDPGIGFGKHVKDNMDLINRLDEFKPLGFPILLGPSRKSFIGAILDLPVEDRLEGTLAAISIGILRGADIIRAHDVKSVVRAARMTDAIVRKP